MIRPALILAALALAGCAGATAPPKLNSIGTPVNASEQIAGSLYTAYDAADTAWLGYLTVTPQSTAKKALVAAVAPKRTAARHALDAFALASVAGNAAAEQAVAQAAIQALSDALTQNGIVLQGSN